MEMLSRTYLSDYTKVLDVDTDQLMGALHASEEERFTFLLEAGALYSSKIEGNTMDLNSFMNAKASTSRQGKEFEEINDLKSAYDFARANPLTEHSFLKAHALLSRLFVSEGNRGVYRQDKVGVFSSEGLVYMAVEHDKVPTEMRKLFEALAEVASKKRTSAEACYFASLAHLQLAHIHPFTDGNGRAARLLEKWILATLLGDRAWLVQSEKYYWDHRKEYYQHINLGVNYYELQYAECVPFLLMLPQALRA